MTVAPLSEISEQELVDFLSDLFWNAFRAAPFEVLCAVLRVSGMQDADWDPFEESKAAFEDYNALLRVDESTLSKAGHWRIGLLMYCQAVEMTAPQEFLANLLRVLGGEKYHIKPFGSLGRTNKKKIFSWVPPSAPAKFRELKRLAVKCNQSALCGYIDQFFNEDIRNAFSHSDYVLSAEHFRWTESGLAQQLPLDAVNLTVRNCFRFFAAVLWLHNQVLTDLKTFPRFHKWPNYEVLELLSDADRLYGFSVHFSNGAKATYSRTENGVDCTNVFFESNGSINFMVGAVDELRPEWKVNGQPYEQAI
ncbi:MAG: hypothetical protein AABM64_11935 [Pseudomonadota bacterium]